MTAKAKLKATADLDSKGFEAGAKRVTSSADRMGKKMGSLKGKMAGAFALGALIRFGKSLADLGGTLSDNAAMTGLSVENFQALELAANRQGVRTDSLTAALVKLRTAQSQALTGDKKMLDNFQQLGLTLGDVANKGMPELLQAIANGRNGTTLYAESLLLGARNAGKLGTTLDQLKDETLPGFVKAAKEAGMVLDDETTYNLDRASDDFAQYGKNIQIWVINKLVQVADGWKLIAASARAAKAEMSGWTWAVFAGEDPGIADLKTGVSDAFKAELKKQALDRAMWEKRRADEAEGRRQERLAKARKTFLDKFESSRGRAATAKVAEDVAPRQNFSSLRRIGANIMGSGARNPAEKALRVNEQQLGVQRKIERNTKRGIGDIPTPSGGAVI